MRPQRLSAYLAHERPWVRSSKWVGFFCFFAFCFLLFPMMNYYLIHKLDHSWFDHPIIWVKSILYCSANPSKNTGPLSGSRLTGFRAPVYGCKAEAAFFPPAWDAILVNLFLLWSIVFGLARHTQLQPFGIRNKIPSRHPKLCTAAWQAGQQAGCIQALTFHL